MLKSGSKNFGYGGGFKAGFWWGMLLSTSLLSMAMFHFSSQQATGFKSGIRRGAAFGFHNFNVNVNGSQRQNPLKNIENNVERDAGGWKSLLLRESSTTEELGRTGIEEYETQRPAIPMGSSSFLFIHVRSYRLGPANFAIIGLAPKQVQMGQARALGKHITMSRSGFKCSWVNNAARNAALDGGVQGAAAATGFNKETNTNVVDETVATNGTAMKYSFEDVMYTNEAEYSGLVVYCNFSAAVGVDGAGGKLVVVAEQGVARRAQAGLSDVEFVAMEERPGEYQASAWEDEEPLPYEYLYCSAPLYGKIDPQRVREWMAYHMRLFGDSSHFIIYDAGGLKEQHWEVLRPWIKLGRVSIISSRDLVKNSGYLSHQFMLANDCLLKSKRLARWMFHFDLDEYMHMTEGAEREDSFHNLMSEMLKRGRRATSLQFLQVPMATDHCLRTDAPESNPTSQSKWAIEKLLYRWTAPENEIDLKNNYFPWKDTKSAYQTKYVRTIGVHHAEQVDVPEELSYAETKTRLDEEDCETCVGNKMHYYHYKGVNVDNGRDLCQRYVDPANSTFEYNSGAYTFDDSMLPLADIVKTFEINKIGPI